MTDEDIMTWLCDDKSIKFRDRFFDRCMSNDMNFNKLQQAWTLLSLYGYGHIEPGDLVTIGLYKTPVVFCGITDSCACVVDHTGMRLVPFQTLASLVSRIAASHG